MRFEEVGFEPERGNLSPEMQATLKRTEAALQAMWARERIESETVYAITVPQQTLTVYGKENFEQVLRGLKKLRVSGTYRVIRKGGADEGS